MTAKELAAQTQAEHLLIGIDRFPIWGDHI